MWTLLRWCTARCSSSFSWDRSCGAGGRLLSLRRGRREKTKWCEGKGGKKKKGEDKRDTKKKTGERREEMWDEGTKGEVWRERKSKEKSRRGRELQRIQSTEAQNYPQCQFALFCVFFSNIYECQKICYMLALHVWPWNYNTVLQCNNAEVMWSWAYPHTFLQINDRRLSCKVWVLSSQTAPQPSVRRH